MRKLTHCVDPDEMPQTVASHLGLHCLLVSYSTVWCFVYGHNRQYCKQIEKAVDESLEVKTWTCGLPGHF